MKATLVTFKCETDTGRSWDEEIEVPEGYDAESFIKQIIDEFNAVSYTHLTLPTNREV